jgi:hypothetical protein
MNERIKELALAAFQPINDIASEGVADRRTFDQAWFQLYNEKFAELIVRECCEQFANHPYEGTKRTQYIYGYIQGRVDAEQQIKEHFGVEE